MDKQLDFVFSSVTKFERENPVTVARVLEARRNGGEPIGKVMKWVNIQSDILSRAVSLQGRWFNMHVMVPWGDRQLVRRVLRQDQPGIRSFRGCVSWRNHRLCGFQVE